MAARIGIGHTSKRRGKGERHRVYTLQSENGVMGGEIGAICLSLEAKFIADVHEISNRRTLKNLMDVKYRPLAGREIQLEGINYIVAYVSGPSVFLRPRENSELLFSLSLCLEFPLSEFEALTSPVSQPKAA